MPELDLSLLRTLVAVHERGSFARAARQVGRSESAVSLQLKRLEEQCGGPLLHRSGRRMVLSDAGTRVLEYARRLLALNDEALTTLRNVPLEATVRVGIPSDVAETWWAPGAGSASAPPTPAWPWIPLVGVAPLLREKLSRGELDLRVVYEPRGDFPVLWSDTLANGLDWAGPIPSTRPRRPSPWLSSVLPARSAAQRCARSTRPAWPGGLPTRAPRWLGTGPRSPRGWESPSGQGRGSPVELRMLGVEDGLPVLPPTTTALESAPWAGRRGPQPPAWRS